MAPNMEVLYLVVIFLVLGLRISAFSGSQMDTRGAEFIFTFPTQSSQHNDYEPKLVITSASDTQTFINITFPGLINGPLQRSVDPWKFISVDLPPKVISDPDIDKQAGTVIVQAANIISLIATSYRPGPNLASFQVLPTSALGTEYVILDWPTSADTFPAEFVITSLFDQTNINYLLTTPASIKGPSLHFSGEQQSSIETALVLHKYEAFQFQAEQNTGLSFTGSRVWSDKPISITAGCACANIPLDPPSSCDYLVSHLIPFEKWGVFHAVAPLMGRTSGYVIQMVAARNDTSVTIGNGKKEPILLNSGDFHQETFDTQEFVTVVADKPISVAQYAKSHSSDDFGDPFMVIVPPVEQYVSEMISFALFDSYTLYQIEHNYISILTECSNIDGLLFDGIALDESWEKLKDAESITCAAQNEISSNSVHNISHVTSNALMTGILYGFGGLHNQVSYGHTVGFGLDKIMCTVYDEVTNSTKEVWCRLIEPVDINCSENVTQNTDSGLPYAIVSWPPVTANDSSGFLDVTCDHANGSKFNITTTIVTCTVVELGHLLASCFFAVRVEDNEIPVIVDCPEDITDFAFEDEEVGIDWEEPYCDDNSGDCYLTTVFTPGEGFTFGETVVTYNATDKSGNVAFCHFTVTIIPRCRSSETTHPELGKTLTWPAATVTETVESNERCPINTDRRGFGFATRTCVNDDEKGAAWREPVFDTPEKPCGEVVEELELEDLEETPVVESNVEEVAEALANVTNRQEETTTDDVTSVSITIQNIVNVASPSSEVTTSVIKTVDNLLDTTEEHDDHSQASNSSSQIIRALERQVSLTASGEGPLKVVEPFIAVQALPVNETGGKLGVGFFTRSTNSIDSRLDGDNSAGTFLNDSGVPNYEIQTSITLPPSLITEGMDETGVNVSFLVFQHEDLFVSERLLNVTSNIVGAIVSAEVHGVNATNLTEAVRVEMSPFKRCITDSNVNSTQCVFWDFTLRDGVGDWSEDGCEFLGFINDRVVCQCYHLTNFAAIAGKSIRSKALDYISMVGCTLSLVSMILTLGIFLSFKKLRMSGPRKIIIQLCASLFCLYLTYIVLFAIDNHTSYDPKCRTENATWECMLLAAFLHYFTLTTLMWMGVEAHMLYRLLVVVFGQKIQSFFKYSFAFAWGSPLVIVGLTLGIGFDEYERLDHCFLSEWPLYLAVAIPIALVLAHNLVVFVFVLHSLLKIRVKGKITKDKSKELLKRLRQGISITLLLGLTWVFGLFAIKSAEDIFAWLFVLFNAIQGTGVFIIFCILQEDVKTTLKPYFSWVNALKLRKDQPVTSLTSETYTHNSEFLTGIQETLSSNTDYTGNYTSPDDVEKVDLPKISTTDVDVLDTSLKERKLDSASTDREILSGSESKDENNSHDIKAQDTDKPFQDILERQSSTLDKLPTQGLKDSIKAEDDFDNEERLLQAASDSPDEEDAMANGGYDDLGE